MALSRTATTRSISGRVITSGDLSDATDGGR